MEENLKTIKAELESIDNNCGWGSLFMTIRSDSLVYDYSCAEAKQPANRPMNRYRDVSPFDHSRVILQNGPCDYINASFVKVPQAGRNYILTQGALPHTAGHFWLMVWEQKSKAVLMLNKVIEKNQIKCHQYWPVGVANNKRAQSQNSGSDGDESSRMDFPDVGLRVHLLSEEDSRQFVVRRLEIEEIGTGSRREILQFHYTNWPDFGVPSTARAFLHFLQAVRDSGALEPDVGPAVVHCSAGIGRSGTFCLADTCLLMMELGIRVNVKEVLLEMRKFRMGLIQTADQLRFSYLAILEGAQQLAEGNTKFMPDLDDELEQNGKQNVNGVFTKNLEDEKIPLPPPRYASLPPPSTLTKEDGYRRIIEEGLMDGRPLPDVPSTSDSEDESSAADDDSEEDELIESNSGSDADTSTSKSYGLMIDVRNNPPNASNSRDELPVPDDIETLPPLPLPLPRMTMTTTATTGHAATATQGQGQGRGPTCPPPPPPRASNSSTDPDTTPERTDVTLDSVYSKLNGVAATATSGTTMSDDAASTAATAEATLRRRAKTEATMEKLRDIKARQKEAEFYQRVYRSITGKHVVYFGIGLSLIVAYFYAARS